MESLKYDGKAVGPADGQNLYSADPLDEPPRRGTDYMGEIGTKMAATPVHLDGDSVEEPMFLPGSSTGSAL